VAEETKNNTCCQCGKDQDWLKRTHRLTYKLSAEACACFRCLRRYPRSEIHEWTDKGATAICPHCGIDSVIPSTAVTDEELRAMRDHWFEE
jgi:NAD-dependent SIR2 family protein deacetylase